MFMCVVFIGRIVVKLMGEKSSKFQKFWTLENQVSKVALCLPNINNFQFNSSIVFRETEKKLEVLL